MAVLLFDACNTTPSQGMRRVISLLLATSRVFAATWPAAADWTAVQHDGAPLTDPCGDVSGSDWWDIVGDSTHPAAYTYDDGPIQPPGVPSVGDGKSDLVRLLVNSVGSVPFYTDAA